MRALFILGLSVLCLGCFQQNIRAMELSSWDAPVPVVSEVLIRGDEIRDGLDFHAALPEAVTFQGMVLPEGTQFIGHLENGKARGHTLFRRNHADIWVDQVIFPNGQRYTLYPGEQVRPHYHFKPKLWGQHPQNIIAIGERLELRFSPAALKGMMQTGMIRQPHPLD